jgi:hypothetical protein
MAQVVDYKHMALSSNPNTKSPPKKILKRSKKKRILKLEAMYIHQHSPKETEIYLDR